MRVNLCHKNTPDGMSETMSGYESGWITRKEFFFGRFLSAKAFTDPAH